MEIKIQFSEDGLFGGWEDMDNYDVSECKLKFAAQVIKSVSAEFPNAKVSAISTINDRVDISDSSGDTLPSIEEEVFYLIGQVYEDYDWVVTK